MGSLSSDRRRVTERGSQSGSRAAPAVEAQPTVEDNQTKRGVMSNDVGVWIDHKKAVIVSIAAGEVTTRTLKSDVGPHPHYSGSQEGGGEKKDHERHNQDLNQYDDDVIGQLRKPDLFCSLGQVKRSGSSRSVSGHSKVSSGNRCGREHRHADRSQIVAKVKEHYGIAR